MVLVKEEIIYRCDKCKIEFKVVKKDDGKTTLIISETTIHLCDMCFTYLCQWLGIPYPDQVKQKTLKDTAEKNIQRMKT